MPNELVPIEELLNEMFRQGRGPAMVEIFDLGSDPLSPENGEAFIVHAMWSTRGGSVLRARVDGAGELLEWLTSLYLCRAEE
jgi:hypothetical protein